jgi:hypothetical protein
VQGLESASKEKSTTKVIAKSPHLVRRPLGHPIRRPSLQARTWAVGDGGKVKRKVQGERKAHLGAFDPESRALRQAPQAACEEIALVHTKKSDINFKKKRKKDEQLDVKRFRIRRTFMLLGK